MILTDQFVFVHMHKTGGQFINRFLLSFVPGSTRIGYHLPRNMTPASHRHLPTVAFIRNPWAWYVSWDAFNRLEPDRNPIFRVLSDSGTLDFAATIERMLKLGEPQNADLRTGIAQGLAAASDRPLGSGITPADVATIRNPAEGYYTWLLRRMLELDGRMENLVLGRTETLRQHLLQILTQFSIPVSAQMRDIAANAEAVNASPHTDYRSYYDATLRDLVARKDAYIIESFDYAF